MRTVHGFSWSIASTVLFSLTLPLTPLLYVMAHANDTVIAGHLSATSVGSRLVGKINYSQILVVRSPIGPERILAT